MKLRVSVFFAALALAAPALAGDDDLVDDAVFMRQRTEGLAVRSLKSILTAQTLFREGDKDGDGNPDFAADLAALGRAKLISAELAKTGALHGYRFKLLRSKTAPTFLWMATATPIKPGVDGTRSFAVTFEGVILHALKPFALREDCKPKGTKVDAPLAGWTPLATPLGALLQKAGKLQRRFRTYLVPADKSLLVYSEVSLDTSSYTQVETMIVERGGRVTALRYTIDAAGFLLNASIRRGKLTDRRRTRETWLLQATHTDFAVTQERKPAPPLAASPLTLAPDIMMFLVPRLLTLTKGTTFRAPLVTLGIASGPAVLKGEASVRQSKQAGGLTSYTLEHVTHPGGTISLAPGTGPSDPKIRSVQSGSQRLSVIDQPTALGLIKSFIPKAARTSAAQTKLARSQLYAIKAALANYQTDMGRYPRLAPRPIGTKTEAGLADDAPALYGALLNRPTLATGGGQNAPYIDTWKTIGLLSSRALLEAAKIGAGAKRLTAAQMGQVTRLGFQRTHGPQSPNPLVLLDPWGNPYHYREWASVRDSVKDAMLRAPVKRTVTVKGKAKVVKDHPHNVESFDLWSNGPNGINEYGAPDSDDVASWRR